MTLHDRIMGLIPDDITNGGEEFYDGFAEASRKAAQLATEADELMAQMAEALLFCADQLSDENDCARCLDNIAEDSARRALIGFKNWKEQNNEHAPRP